MLSFDGCTAELSENQLPAAGFLNFINERADARVRTEGFKWMGSYCMSLIRSCEADPLGRKW
jgi:hypothetical protein